jgi:uncharacterized protein DUF3995
VDKGWSTEPLAMTVMLITAVLKVLAGLLALALVLPWAHRFPRKALLSAAWSAAVLLTVYGAAQLTTQILIKAGVIPVPDDFDWQAFPWHLWLWSPWFLL